VDQRKWVVVMPVRPVRYPAPPSPPEHTRQYDRFRGVDFSTDPAKVDRSRSPYAQNVVSDAGGYPEKRPGWAVLQTITGGSAVNGLHFFVTSGGTLICVAHVGTKLYTWDEEATTVTLEVTGTATSDGDISISLDGADPVVIAVLTTDDLAGIAAKIAAGEYEGWTAAADGAEVTFTAAVPGDKADPVFDGGTTGATATTAMHAPTSIYASMADAKSVSFVHNGKLYLLDGAHYLVYDGTNPVAAVTGYIPTTVIGRAPSGGGTVLEPVNLLAAGRKNSFIGDGGEREVCRLQISTGARAAGNLSIILGGATVNVALLSTDDTVAEVLAKVDAATYTGWSKQVVGDTVIFTADAVGAKSDAQVNPNDTGVLCNMITLTQGADAVTAYQLDAAGLDDTAVTAVVAGVAKAETTDFSVDRSTGVVTFNTAPPSGQGVDNVVITFYKTVAGYADRISKCRIATWFGMGNDSRVFVSGNPDYPNMDWQSGLYDPTYFPDTGYTKVGADSSAIMGYLKQFDNLLVIKADNEQDATIYKRTAELDADGNPVFPLRQGVAGVGAVSRDAFGVLRDDPLFLAKEGVFALTTGYGDVTQQRYAQERSGFVKARLTREAGMENAVAAVWNGLYVLCVNGRAYVADSKQKTGKSSTETAGYEWYYWTNIPAVCFMVYADKLYFGTDDGRICRFSTQDSVYRFADDGQPIVAIWSTIADDDGDWMRYKTMPRKGSGVMIKPYSRSSVKIYVRTDTLMDTLVKTAGTDIFDFADVDFTAFTFETADAPQVIPLGTKVKRYKTLQIIVKNDTVNEGFGVYGIIKRYTLGNVVK
jgi:hypothetical protein